MVILNQFVKRSIECNKMNLVLFFIYCHIKIETIKGVVTPPPDQNMCLRNSSAFGISTPDRVVYFLLSWSNYCNFPRHFFKFLVFFYLKSQILPKIFSKKNKTKQKKQRTTIKPHFGGERKIEYLPTYLFKIAMAVFFLPTQQNLIQDYNFCSTIIRDSYYSIRWFINSSIEKIRVNTFKIIENIYNAHKFWRNWVHPFFFYFRSLLYIFHTLIAH